jgi:hypothetical protein
VGREKRSAIVTKKEQPKRLQQATSFRLSPDGKAFLAALSVSLGISQAAVLEQAIRLLARREGIKLPTGGG